MIVFAPACMRCKHYHRAGEGKPVTCSAFPVRIPDLIWLKGDKHTSPVEGDHGIQFEPRDPASPLPSKAQ